MHTPVSAVHSSFLQYSNTVHSWFDEQFLVEAHAADVGSTDIELACARHSLLYVVPLHPQTGTKVSGQVAGTFVHTPKSSPKHPLLKQKLDWQSPSSTHSLPRHAVPVSSVFTPAAPAKQALL